MNKMEFNKALVDLVETAIGNGYRLTHTQIQEAFPESLENQAHRDAIYEYLAQRKIKVLDNLEGDLEDDTAKAIEKDSSYDISGSSDEMEKRYLEMYLEDLSNLLDFSVLDISLWIERYQEGDMNSRDKLIEHYLDLVVKIAQQYKGNGVSEADLIQEGNLGLVEAISNFDGESDYAETFFRKHIIKYISNAMQNAIDEERGSAHIATHLVERVNALSDATTYLAEKLGREATLKELSEYMSLPEDEIREAMKISLDAITVDETPKA